MAEGQVNEKNFLNTFLMVLAFLGGVIVTSHWFLRNKQAAEISNIAVSEVSVNESSPGSTEVAGVTSLSMEDLIIEAFVKKYEKSPEEVTVIVGDKNGSYVRGTVSFEGELGGGWFLAAKDTEDQWQIVADGNGNVLCEDIEDYTFPTDIVPECWDTAAQTLIKR